MLLARGHVDKLTMLAHDLASYENSQRKYNKFVLL